MSVLSSRVDVTRTRFSTKTCPDTGPGAAPVRLTIQKVSGEHQRSSGRAKPGRKSHGGAPRRTLAGSQPGRDLLTSHFEAGSRGVVLAALQQRSHSASQRREVKVQLIEPQQRNSSSSSSSSHNAPGGHKGAQSRSSNQGDDLSAMKEGHMDVGVCQQVDTIDRDGWASRMEAVHHRQLELQNQLLQSALTIVARCTSSDLPPQPAVQQADPAEAVINPSTRTSVESDPVTMGTHTDHTREERRRRARVVSVATQANDSPAREAGPQREAGPAQTEREAPLPPSTLEEARRLLRRLRRQKKILDDNLETAERARSGEVLRCQLEALAANSESSERARVKRTVDAWIHLISNDVQARMALGGTASGRPPAGRGRRSQAAAAPPARVPAQLPPADRSDLGSPVTTARRARSVLQGRPPPGHPAAAALRPADAESYLTRLYGRAPRKAPTAGLRRSPPLRFNSTPAPVNRKPRPQALDGAKGAATKGPQPKAAPRRPSAESADLPAGPARAKAPSVAIPLARPRIGPSPGRRRNVSSPPVAVSLLVNVEAEHEAPERPAAGPPPAPDPPGPDPPSQPSPGPLEEPQELASEFGALADEGLEVQPDSPVGLEQEQAEPPDDPDPRPAASVAAERVARQSRDDPEEGGEIPGREFLSVVDAGQDESAADEGASHGDGDPSPPLLVYQGPAGPAENRGAIPPPPRSSAPNLDDRTLDRMVQWLERQLMARMIRGQSPPPPPEQNEQSDVEEPSLASAVGERGPAADVRGLQFFVDAGVQADSPLVKELVNEVLSEMVDQVLAPREPPVPGPAPDRGPNPGPGGPSSFRGETVPVVPVVPVLVTPLPTPLPSPVASIDEPLPLSTPAPSEATSVLIDESPQPSVAAPPEPVATPIPSPEPSPPAEITPPSVHRVADAPSDDTEERPDTRSQPPEAEEAVGSPPRALSPAAPPPQDDAKSPSAASDDSASSSAGSSNSSTVTASETGLKAVSEGELLISFNHVDATTEADTSSSSLHDEDLEPPSEGQVKVHMIEMAHTLRGERSLEEEEELSSGEVTDSIALQLDRKINHSGEAILEPTNGGGGGGGDVDLTPAASHMLASDLQSEPAQVLPFRRSSLQAGHPEVSVRTSAPPATMSPSSEDSSDFF